MPRLHQKSDSESESSKYFRCVELKSCVPTHFYLLSKPTTSIDMHRQKIEILTLRLSLRKLKLSRARQCPTVHPVSVVEGSQAWRWEAWEPRDSTYNMHLRKSQPENHRHVVEYAFNLLPGRKSERLPCHPCSAWQAPCERAVHLIYPSAPLSFSATSSATAVSFTIEFVQLQWVSLFQNNCAQIFTAVNYTLMIALGGDHSFTQHGVKFGHQRSPDDDLPCDPCLLIWSSTAPMCSSTLARV